MLCSQLFFSGGATSSLIFITPSKAPYHSRHVISLDLFWETAFPIDRRVTPSNISYQPQEMSAYRVHAWSHLGMSSHASICTLTQCHLRTSVEPLALANIGRCVWSGTSHLCQAGLEVEDQISHDPRDSDHFQDSTP
jgi:hypothetical protein